MEASFDQMAQISCTLNMAPPSKLLVNAGQKSIPIGDRGLRFFDIECVTEYYELTPEMQAEI